MLRCNGAYDVAGSLAIDKEVHYFTRGKTNISFFMGDREHWLRQTLPNVRAPLVLSLDAFDTMLLCGAQEIACKYRSLVGDGDTVVVSVSWPPPKIAGR